MTFIRKKRIIKASEAKESDKRRKENKKMITIVLLVVLFFRPILRAVGLINEALNAGLDRAENKIKTEVK